METSVEEIILEEISKTFRFDQAKFSSSGREDVDVRMLGTGRPFLFEIANPRKTKSVSKIILINDSFLCVFAGLTLQILKKLCTKSIPRRRKWRPR